ncbi:MAG: exodeoxyribonuclease VII large subunit, partial [Pseudomonadota bacterium]
MSAVGHDTDPPRLALASARRAPTPTAAADMAVPVRLDLLAWLDGQEARLTSALTGGIKTRRQRVMDLSRALPRAEALLETPRQRLDLFADRLPRGLIRGVEQRRVRLSEASGALRPSLLRRGAEADRRRLKNATERLNLDAIKREMARKATEFDAVMARMAKAATRQVERWSDRLDSLERVRQTVGYEATLQRGYAVVRGDGDVVTSRAAAKKAAALEIQFADGRLDLGANTEKTKRAKTTPVKSPEQGSLF